MTTVEFRPGLEHDIDRNPFRQSWEKFEVENCAVQPLGSEETRGNNRDYTVSFIRIFIENRPPQEIPLTAEVLVRGSVYSVSSVDEWAEEVDECADEFGDDSAISLVVDARRSIGGGRG